MALTAEIILTIVLLNRFAMKLAKLRNSIKSLAIKKNTDVKITTTFLKGKMPMFAKVLFMSFVYDIIDVFCFPTTDVLYIYKQNKTIKSLIFLNLTDTDPSKHLF